MPIHHLPASGYVATPWKNGAGVTEEILLLPTGATQASFALRASRASIPKPGPFSAFPGVDRTITLIEGEALVLEFDDFEIRLEPLHPYTFDSGLTPVGRPVGGGVRVLNVMAARNRWQLGAPEMITSAIQPAAPGTGMAFAHVIEGQWRAQGNGAGFVLRSGDSSLLEDEAGLAPIGVGTVLLVPLARAQ